MEGKSSTVIEVSATEQNNASASQVPQNLGENDVEVDITECTKSGENGLVESECQSTTENSSSFGDTMSGTDNYSTLNDIDVESPFFGGNVLASVSDVYNRESPLRKTKLTDQWKKFIHPIMWRCKWIELQIKEFQSQTLKYDRELSGYDQMKQIEFEESTSEGFDSKSRPFSFKSRRNQIMKRKKRKRVEEMTDLASYMLCHNIFSYHEYKKFIADNVRVDNECINLDDKTVNGNDRFGFNEGWSFLEFRDGDNSRGQMLSKIEMIQSQINKLKTRIDKVVSENSGMFSSINRLSMHIPCDVLTSSDRNAASQPKRGNETPDRSLYIASQHISEGNTGSLFMHGSSVSSHGEVTLPPDMIGYKSQPQVGDSCENNEDNGLLILNQASDEELHSLERIMSQLTEKPQMSKRKRDAISPLESRKTDSPTKISVPDGQPSTSRSNVRNIKSKWGNQKSRSGRWKR